MLLRGSSPGTSGKQPERLWGIVVYPGQSTHKGWSDKEVDG
jgi:hypothetical protein